VGNGTRIGFRASNAGIWEWTDGRIEPPSMLDFSRPSCGSRHLPEQTAALGFDHGRHRKRTSHRAE
jgi:hypothetical protein